MLEEKIANELIRRFSKIRLDHEAIRKQFEEAARRQKEAAEANKNQPQPETAKSESEKTN
jgi:hypothetical protein